MKNFKFLTGDVNYVDYGGKWYREVRKGCYHIIELTNMPDACGADAIYTYCVDLAEVDVLATSQFQLDSALNSCGWDGIHDLEGRQLELATAEILHGHGNKAPLGQWESNNYLDLMKDARALSRVLDDPAAHERQMNRPVNQIGSTAREFMQGDILAGMQRGVEANDATAKLMAKLHGVPAEAIDAVVAQGPSSGGIRAGIRMHDIKRDGISDDPIAFSMGYMNGFSGCGLDQPGCERDELAPAFIEGHKLGVDVKTGKEERPMWHQ